MSAEPTPWRRAPWFAGMWLFFLFDPLHEAWLHRDEARGQVALVAIVAFAAFYLNGWLHGRARRSAMQDPPGWRWVVRYVTGLAVLSAVIVATIGERGLATLVYLGAALVMSVPIRFAAPAIAALTLGLLTLGPAAGWGSQATSAFSLVAASIAVFGITSLMNRTSQLVRAQQENAELAVENERIRFSRDLHDILGHSLTVITVKAELAGQLIDVDLDRTRAEIADLERLSRDALADVRRAVEGYRDLTLPGELTQARHALAAADIEAALPNSTDEVPGDLRTLFAWAVREGITNVLRHSHASRCDIVLTATSVEVRDDGRGCGTDPSSSADTARGSGLRGLRERARDAGAVVLTRDLQPGWSLKVTRTEDEESVHAPAVRHDAAGQR